MEDQKKKHYKVAVRELVEHMLRSGDLVMEFSLGNRQQEGLYAHQKLQKSRPEEYRKEVVVSFQVETDTCILDIGGRIDGVFQYPDGAVVEEIKSTRKDLTVHRAALESREVDNPRHWGQLKTYAYIYALREELDEIAVRLTYYQVDNGATLELDRTYSRAELETFFQELVERYLEWAEKMNQWALRRNRSCEDIAFPYDDYRPGQHKMALAIYHTVEQGRQLIAQAPTGTGKTMAALFPTVKALGRGLCAKFFYLTARTTGRTVAEKALQTLREKGLSLKTLTLTAKDKICFSPGSACNGEECPFAKGYYDRVDGALNTFFERDAFTRSVVEETARRFEVCPFEFSLELSLWADGIVCDYNYAFDPSVYLRRFFGEEEIGGDYVFLIDEAHNLVDRARDMFSAELQKGSFLDLRRKIKDYVPDLYKAAGRVNNHLREKWNRCDENGGPTVDDNAPDELLKRLTAFNHCAEKWLAKELKTLYRDDVLELYFEVSRFCRTAERFDDNYATYCEKYGKDLKIKLFCIDPSRLLREAFTRCKGAVLFSATMTPAHYFRKILGCLDDTRNLVLSSPFPPENLCLAVCHGISTIYRHRDHTKGAVARAISHMVAHKGGNYLVFFPSYKYMTTVHELFVESHRDAEILVQTPGMSEEERDAFLRRFDENRGNGLTLLGFAVMGGIFGEGIDLVGDRLTGAAVVGVGLPAICLERNLIREYFDDPERAGAGFEYAYVFPGINRVLQAAGRVIRSETDRGVVLLIDERFSWNQYKSLFPREWRPYSAADDGRLARLLQNFWGA